MSNIYDLTGNIIKADGFVGADGEVADAIADVAVTFTSGSAPAVDGSITIANAGTPTVVELLALIYELKAKHEALVDAAVAAGIVASA